MPLLVLLPRHLGPQRQLLARPVAVAVAAAGGDGGAEEAVAAAVVVGISTPCRPATVEAVGGTCRHAEATFCREECRRRMLPGLALECRAQPMAWLPTPPLPLQLLHRVLRIKQ